MRLNQGHVAVALFFAAVVGGCTDGPAAPIDDGAALLSIEPAGGEFGVPVGTSPTLRFDHPLAAGMESFVVLHRGGLSGPEVDGTWTVPGDRTRLTFGPTQPLDPATQYTLHVGAGMTDEHGSHLGLAMRGPSMGGAWVTNTMMVGAMGMGGMTGTLMGPGWAHPTNGTFGMVFSFTTAG